MKSLQLLRCIFPDVLADYFDVVDIQESVTQFDFWLDERNFMEKSGDSRYLVGIGIYFGKPKKKETFIYNSS